MRRLSVALCVAGFVWIGVPAQATDWPTWRFDGERSAASPEQLPAQLHLQWTRYLPALKPAWPEDPRLHFDASYEPVVAGETLFYGSSANDSVTAVDLETGDVRWRYFADGPVRFAPLINDGRVFFGADDGCLYCLDAKTGQLQWRFQAAPNSRKVIGSERVISVWPVRGGPVLADGKIHFTVGVWPFEGTFLYSVDPETGRLVSAPPFEGPREAAVEHEVITLNDMTPQGYLSATNGSLFIPQGRAAVGVLDQASKKFRSYSYRTSAVTTYHVAASGRWLFHGAVTYDMQTKKQITSSTRTPVIDSGVMYAAEGDSVVAFDLKNVRTVEKTDRRGKKSKVAVLDKLWTMPFEAVLPDADLRKKLESKPLTVAIKAGSRLYAHRGDFLFSIDVAEGKPEGAEWSKEVGPVSSVIAANGRLVVATTNGRMHCFAGEETESTMLLRAEPAGRESREWKDRVAIMLRESAPDGTKGDAYCLALGIGSFGMIDELVRQSQLRIIAIDPEADRVRKLRQEYNDAGLYGNRIVAHVGNPLAFRLPSYMASLIVSETPEAFGLTTDKVALAEMFRVLRPYGGSAWFVGDDAEIKRLSESVALAKLPNAKFDSDGGLARVTRVGALPGSADWTHEYGDPSNTLMSHDRLVKAPLGVLWFGGPAADGSLFYNRHFWGPSMAVINGRMFLQGPQKMTAVDVYTGRILWQIPLTQKANYLPGRRGNDFERTLAGHHFLVVDDAMYLVHEKSCLKIDPATGEQINEFKLASRDDDWGRIRVTGDKLIAEVFRDIDADKSKLPPEKHLIAGTKAAVEVLAIDRHTGSKLWSYEAEASFPVMSVGKDRIFLFDGALANFYADWKRRGVIPKASDIRYAKAIDLETGKLIWRKRADIVGTWVSYSEGQDVVLMSNKSSIVALNGRNGDELWKQYSEGVGFKGHPESLWDRLIVWNDRILDQRGPGLAWNLKTGKRVPRLHPITSQETPWEFTKAGHHCNYAIASPHLMTFRAQSAGFCDIESGNTSRLQGFRSGCRNSLIPANGVLNAPNMAHGCICGYSLFTSLALVHLPESEVWSYSALKLDPKKDAIRQVGINFGAPGDRQDESGMLWLDYPNRGGSSPAVSVAVSGDTPRYFRRHSSLMKGDGMKWVAGSGVDGVSTVTVTLSKSEDAKPQKYSVRLHFSEPDRKKSGERVFDVAIQGRPVLKDFDIARETGGANRALSREFVTEAISSIRIELSPKAGRPVLSGIALRAIE